MMALVHSFKFDVEPLYWEQWVITATRADDEPVYLIGVYSSYESAAQALPKSAAGWLALKRVEQERLDAGLTILAKAPLAANTSDPLQLPIRR